MQNRQLEPQLCTMDMNLALLEKINSRMKSDYKTKAREGLLGLAAAIRPMSTQHSHLKLMKRPPGLAAAIRPMSAREEALIRNHAKDLHIETGEIIQRTHMTGPSLILERWSDSSGPIGKVPSDFHFGNFMCAGGMLQNM